MSRPRLLDLFAGAGGATRGYQQAGFHVIGVDINPQPNYVGDEFHQAGALTFPLDGYDAIHASPPCQAYTTLRALTPDNYYPDLYETVRGHLVAAGVPWVIENVPGAPYRQGVVLCGSMFGLRVRRHRNFEASFLMLAPSCRHAEQGQPLGVYGTGGGGQMTRGRKATRTEAPEAMGIDWMAHRELSQAIPPSYTHWIGEQLIRQINGPQADAQIERELA